MQIKVISSSVEDRHSDKTGKDWKVQVLLVELNLERRLLEIFHNQNSELYKTGSYKIADSSYVINEYKKLELKWLKLEPLSVANVRTA